MITLEENSTTNKRKVGTVTTSRGIGKMARRIFCDECGKELQPSSLVQLFERELCSDCCTKILKAK